ncbi:DNA polymerase III subunit alpha [Hugenholtzia roseola]|uniref:DNA polymerase III subunit alpha n=1 Tax=Hugenholtzia roseola TaxID=1002 RepID=UPI000412932E|nr:DNA polymerase III subunit alpha [Hugenholtzia roseola]
MPNFNHLHVHTQFSLLDGAASISGLMKKAKADGMTAVALTDHGNMLGAFKFVAEADKNDLLPIIGCEFYLVKDRHAQKFSKGEKDVRHHQLFLAKNAEGYQNLSKLCSLGYIEGMYSKYPRIDKELILKYHKGIIATSCCIGAEIPQTILKEGVEKAEEKLKWWIDIFGEDYYIELQRHGLENIDGTGISQEDINQILIGWAKKYNLKIIATNDSHYINEDDWNAHDILLCINTGEKISTPKGDGKGFRFAFPNSEFYFKTQAEMNKIFADLPQALDNTLEITSKVEKLKLKRDILLPNFQLPEGFKTQDEFLRHLSYQGAKQKYGTLTAELEARINLELSVIEKMGFPGYFLIVQDFINAARKINVAVGPGRGSAAGSVVAYCTGITNIDPIRYNLLFERFLNPERVSMPDIDVDFDDEGRQKVIDYVVDKYGKTQVAQIITYGTMAAKMAIKDVARVLELPLDEANALAKLVPEKAGTTLDKAFEEVAELEQIRKGNDLKAKVLREAKILEGSVRGTGIHAAGVIIAPDDITKYIPVCTAKDSDLLVTQFDGKHIEDAGMLKMDFLGLKTLTIIKDAIDLIEKNHGIRIDPDEIPLDDPKTYELYQRGDTVGTFQFESDGMRKYLKDLKPTNIEDLIAMNALYRPGPLEFIPTYIDRKHGKEKVEYPHELLRPILEPTFGIMIYQEQIMQAAQIMGGYTLGGADLLRRAMGKKNAAEMARQKAIFVEGAKKHHNIDAQKAEEVFNVMEKFAAYGFNRSHSAAYSVVAFQTGYLKANYPAEYMAAVMTHNMNNIEKITFFIEEAQKMGVPVLGPDVNESYKTFAVNNEGKIRFGMAAIKGAGEAAVESIIEEREENGKYKDIFDFAARTNWQTVNKRVMEALILAGGFDEFTEIHRAQYFAQTGDKTNLELLINYGKSKKDEKDSSQNSLFLGGSKQSQEALTPRFAPATPWTEIEKLNKEKEVVGFYISGHPLDQYKFEIKSLCNTNLSELSEKRGSEALKVAGLITEVSHRTTANGKPFGMFTVEDYNGSAKMALFGEEYKQNKDFLQVGEYIFITGKMEERYNSKGSYEFRPKTLKKLADLKVNTRDVSLLQLSIDIQTMPADLVTKLDQLFNENRGNCTLKMEFVWRNKEKEVKLNSVSRDTKITPTNSLLNELDRMGVRYQMI